jgi:hypothetical protein
MKKLKPSSNRRGSNGYFFYELVLVDDTTAKLTNSSHDQS